MAAGADGIMVEVHPDPATAKSDGPQALTPAMFETLMGQIRALREAMAGFDDGEAAQAGRAH